jgi:DNA-binding MarR family transcriptional regulator
MDERTRATELIRRINRFSGAGDLGDVAFGELTVAQLRVLFRLRGGGPVPSGQLANQLGVTLPTVTSVIDRLVKQELVERRDDPGDRRRVIVAVTPAGRALVERIQQGRHARLVRALDAIEPVTLAKLIDGLAALAAAADQLEIIEAPEPVAV